MKPFFSDKLEYMICCPKCSYPANGFAAQEPGLSISKGDLAVCVNCGEINTYDQRLLNNDFYLRPLTDQELEQLQKEEPDTFEQTMKMQAHVKSNNIIQGRGNVRYNPAKNN